jgi:hypothetical protein
MSTSPKGDIRLSALRSEGAADASPPPPTSNRHPSVTLAGGEGSGSTLQRSTSATANSRLARAPARAPSPDSLPDYESRAPSSPSSPVSSDRAPSYTSTWTAPAAPHRYARPPGPPPAAQLPAVQPQYAPPPGPPPIGQAPAAGGKLRNLLDRIEPYVKDAVSILGTFTRINIDLWKSILNLAETAAHNAEELSRKH